MSQPTTQIDPVSAVVAVVSMAFAQEVANVVGPYLIILFASTIGASFALKAKPKMPKLRAAGFFFRVNGVSILLTYFIASIAQTYYPTEDIRNWFAPVAFSLGVVGDRWPALMEWAAGKVSRLVDILIKLRGDGGSNG